MRIESFKKYNDSNSYRCGDINVIIGPNNSGKTTFLNEIYQSIADLSRQDSKIIANFDISFERIANQDFWKKMFPKVFESSSFSDVDTPLKAGSTYASSHIKDAWNSKIYDLIKNPVGIPQKVHIGDDRHRSAGVEVHRSFINFCRALFVEYEKIEDRFNENFDLRIGDIITAYESAESPLMNLRNNDDEFEYFQKIIVDIFDYHVDFDDLVQGQKSLYISRDPDFKEKIPGDMHSSERAMYYAEELDKLYLQGHGIRAFAKIVLSLFTDRTQLVLIDEPEAFIHPPQRRALARAICELSKTQDKQLFLASHDAEFLTGILKGASEHELDVQFFYLNRDNEDLFLKHVSPEKINEIAQQSKSRVLNERLINGLFYRRIVLVENESDRSYYELAAKQYGNNIFDDTCFIGLSGISDVLAQREQLADLFGAAVHAIVDFDFFVEPPGCYKDLAQPLPETVESVEAVLAGLIDNNKISKNALKQGGRSALQGSDFKLALAQVDGAIEKLRDHGIHVVPNGALESFFELENRDKKQISFSDEMNVLALDKKTDDLKVYLTDFIDTVCK